MSNSVDLKKSYGDSATSLNISMLLASLKNEILELLFPLYCLGCRAEGTFLCTGCKNSLTWIPPSCFVCQKLVPPQPRLLAGRTCKYCRRKSHIWAFLSPFAYEDTISELIHGLKYRRITALDSILAELLVEYLNKFRVNFKENPILIPVPLHPGRERIRGFNQSELIARKLAGCLSFRLEPEVLRKVKKTTPQVGLPAEERKRNVQNSFLVSRPNEVWHKTVILVDDVKTTGATLEEAARVLKEAGAKRVWAVTVAH